ncbi:transcription factor [Geomonas sp. Red276]
MFRKLILFVLVLALTALGSITRAEQLPKQGKLPPITVLSIIPAQGEPGMTVTVNGTGFAPGTTPFLGTVQLAGNVIGGRTVTFDLPDLPAGVYAFYLKREDGSTSRAFNFTIQPLRPVASGLSPDNIAVCATGREREVLLTGSNFQPGARVLFDGAAVATRFISSAALAFTVPQLPGGLHQVQVKNPSDAASGNLALVIDAKPEILNVTIGNDFVSYYELLISGRNFQQTSVLVVDGNRVATGRPAVGERDQLIFLGCNQFVYQRHPYDTTPKEIRLQVVNPGSEESPLYTISAP